MKYEDFERAQELQAEVSALQDIAITLQPDEYAEYEPVMICRKSADVIGSPVRIPAELARELACLVWERAHEKEKEFEAL